MDCRFFYILPLCFLKVFRELSIFFAFPTGVLDKMKNPEFQYIQIFILAGILIFWILFSTSVIGIWENKKIEQLMKQTEILSDFKKFFLYDR